MFKINLKPGQTLIELLIAIGLAAVLLPALVSGIAAARAGKSQQSERLAAVGYLKEAEEAIRAARNNDWINVQSTGIYHPVISANTWTLQNNSETINGYTRAITISSVSRDNSGLISTSGTNPDPSVKKVDISVSWNTPSLSQVTSTLYLSRYINNNFFTDTSVTDFTKTGSVLTSTQAVSPSFNNSSTDGQVILSQAGAADWCAPQNPVAKLDLTGNGETRSVVAGINRAFVSSGGNNSGRDFWNITVNNSVFPPIPQEAGTYDANGVKVNQVFGESHFAYLTTDKNSSEVIILDVATNTPQLLLNLDLPNNTNGKSIFVANDYLFVTTADNKLYRYLLAGDRKSATPKGSFNLSSTGNNIYVSNNYVFIAMNSTSTQLQIINATNPNSLQSAGSLSMGNNQAGQDIFESTDGTRAYFVTRRSSAQPEFFIVNTSNKSSPAKIGSGYDTGLMDPQGITTIDNRAIIVGLGRPQYQVVNVDGDGYTQCAIVPKTGDPNIDDIYDVSSIFSGGHAYSYIVTANSNNEFQIIEGGLGGAGGYTSSGSYKSATFGYPNAASPTQIAFNRADVTVNKPAGTDVQFQVAVADAVGGSCTGASFTFVGPTGPGSSFATGASSGTDITLSFPIPFPQVGWTGYVNPGKCFQYKAALTTTDTSKTPYLKDVTINYSP